MDINQVQSIAALNSLQDVARPYLETRPDKYYLVVKHEDKTNLSPSLGYLKQTNRRSKSISQEIQGEHQHWLIWWSGKHLFQLLPSTNLFPNIAQNGIEEPTQKHIVTVDHYLLITKY